MIIGNTAKIGIGKNLKYLLDKGYELPYEKDNRGRLTTGQSKTIDIQIKDLPPMSNAKVRVMCEYCKVIRSVKYTQLVTNPNSCFNKDGTTPCAKCYLTKVNSGKENTNYIHGCNRYAEYRWASKQKNRTFNLSVDFFKKIIKKPCHYCGGYSTEYDPKSRGNGIDRKDSSIGYVENNCVPCCSRCNFIKNNMSGTEFIKHIRQIYKTTKNYEI